MKGKTHAGIGASAFLMMSDKLPGKFNSMGLIMVMFASLIPDIDHPKSIINKYILPFKDKKTKTTVYICLGLVTLWFDFLYVREPALKVLGITFIFVAMSSHRNGLTHSLVGLIIFSFIGRYLGEVYKIDYVGYYVMIGYGMHLVCDMFTKMGVPLFYPFIKKKYKFPFTYKVSSPIGNSVEDFLIIIGIVYMIYRLPGIL